jgi:hypothetical protein
VSNPFAAPLAESVSHPVDGDGPWQQDGRVLASSGVVWPRRCVRCNSADVVEPPLRVAVQWHPTWVWFLILVGILFYLIASLVTRRHGVVNVYLCATHHQHRTWGRIGLGVALAAMMASLVVGYATDNAWLMLAAFVLLVPAGLAGMALRLVRPKHIEGSMLTLVGPHVDFVAALPVLPVPS